MKICAIICEYNPFHNGHKYLIERARALSGCDAVLCIMSASFTQRGEAAILPKFQRAVHAVMGGADAVLQLPALFSVAPAEIFAQGAVSILSSIPAITCLAFGSENDDDAAIKRAAELTRSEQFNSLIKGYLAGGESYKRSFCRALEDCGTDSIIANSPNATLGIEYAAAIRRLHSNIAILPIARIGGGYADSGIKPDYSSASAIRANIGNAAVATSLPDYVYNSIKETDISGARARTDALVRYVLNTTAKAELTEIFGCTEGLENKLADCTDITAEDIIMRATGRRYTSSRIRRILASAMLKLRAEDAVECLKGGTYIKPLALRADMKDILFAELAKSPMPTIIRQQSLNAFSPLARRCYTTDCRADEVRAIIYGTKAEYDYTVKLV